MGQIQYGRKNIQGANEKLSSLWRSSPNPEPGHDAEVRICLSSVSEVIPGR